MAAESILHTPDSLRNPQTPLLSNNLLKSESDIEGNSAVP
jgi:hypothetical protein